MCRGIGRRSERAKIKYWYKSYLDPVPLYSLGHASGKQREARYVVDDFLRLGLYRVFFKGAGSRSWHGDEKKQEHGMGHGMGT